MVRDMAAQAHVNPVFTGATTENWSETPSSSNKTNEGRLTFNSYKTGERRLTSRKRKCVAIFGTTCFVIVILAAVGSWWFWIRPGMNISRLLPFAHIYTFFHKELILQKEAILGS